VNGFENISFLQVDMPNPEVTCISVTLPDVPVNFPNPGIDQLMFETVETIPEPAPLAVLGLGIAGLIVLRRRKAI